MGTKSSSFIVSSSSSSSCELAASSSKSSSTCGAATAAGGAGGAVTQSNPANTRGSSTTKKLCHHITSHHNTSFSGGVMRQCGHTQSLPHTERFTLLTRQPLRIAGLAVDTPPPGNTLGYYRYSTSWGPGFSIVRTNPWDSFVGFDCYLPLLGFGGRRAVDDYRSRTPRVTQHEECPALRPNGQSVHTDTPFRPRDSTTSSAVCELSCSRELTGC